jgi:flavin reductase (DIM6/NTAB) family NADH-FMN oxidoreductase RutF
VPVSAEDFKQALRQFASGVTIVTVSSNGKLHGATASSFASVSLEPPLILVCLDKTSQTRALLLEEGAFAANVLGSEQEEVARAFSVRGVKPFDRLPHRLGVDGAPLLEGAIAWIECRVHQVVDAGDHDIIIGEVIACSTGSGAPLVYYDAAYRLLNHDL